MLLGRIRVAASAGLGLSAPKGKPAEDVTVSPALVQLLAEPGPTDGRKIDIVADAGSDLAGISKLVKAAAALGVTALVIAPAGGALEAGRPVNGPDRSTLMPAKTKARAHLRPCGVSRLQII